MPDMLVRVTKPALNTQVEWDYASLSTMVLNNFGEITMKYIKITLIALTLIITYAVSAQNNLPRSASNYREAATNNSQGSANFENFNDINTLTTWIIVQIPLVAMAGFKAMI